MSALGILLLVLRPPIEIHETHLQLGRRAIAWSEIRRWIKPDGRHHWRFTFRWRIIAVFCSCILGI